MSHANEAGETAFVVYLGPSNWGVMYAYTADQAVDRVRDGLPREIADQPLTATPEKSAGE